MFLGLVITYRDLLVYILVLYVRLHIDFCVQSQYNSEQLMLPSYYNRLNFVVRYGRCIFKIRVMRYAFNLWRTRCVARQAVRLYQCNNTNIITLRCLN